ncbi:MAG TPA: ABC transporter ATP-binding protein [Gemmatimonadales bacterium]|jgi:ABC-2 type transport system ATP-binding protein|nr:ABC transporter ATP-binding protein [Gemmatimonadales bacterium]
MSPAIQTSGLRKVYPAPPERRRGRPNPRLTPPDAAPAPFIPAGVREIIALDGLDLEVAPGEFFGLLGPNGAGKTTTIGVLTTRVRPTAGTAAVAGIDVSADPVGVKQRIGVVPQRPNPDRQLTAIQNLLFHAAYFGIPRSTSLPRAQALLEQLELGDRGESKVDQLSGGQQQRLMIARALIHEPEILFLDEPTVGLDPQARLELWDILRSLQGQGRTIIMTTHYMEEADRLCDRLAIIDHGRLLALDSPTGLRARAPGGTLVEVTLDGDAAPLLARLQAVPTLNRLSARGVELSAYAQRVGEAIAELLRAAEQAGRLPLDIRLTPPSLETLFVSLTGRKLD